MPGEQTKKGGKNKAADRIWSSDDNLDKQCAQSGLLSV